MSSSGSGPDLLGQLADEFLARHRRGERPALTEYAARHPDLANQIRDLFPTLLVMEEVRPPQAVPCPAKVSGCPQRLGEYRIVREIGRGGMGVVYEAEQESLGRRVALKILPTGTLGGASQVKRFQREARAAARLHHTNIVPVFAVGEEEGIHYYVMQYIEGQPLDQVLAGLRRLRAEDGDPPASGAESQTAQVSSASATGLAEQPGHSSGSLARSLWQGQFRHTDEAAIPDQEDGEPSPPASPAPPPRSEATATSSFLSNPHRPYAKSVAHLGVQVADALEYAAGQGVLHRDVKPSNLLLDVWGTVWLTDFGLAKATGTPDLTVTGHLLGTLRYLAPERFEGQADNRSDVYALGLTLYEMLALRPAFDGHDEAEVARKITASEPVRLDRVNPALPRDLVTIVHKAMAREPADRYQTAAALADDLRRFLDDRSIVARRVSLPEQAWRWCRRNPTGAALVAALAALALLAVGSGLWLERQQSERRQEALQRQQQAREAVETALERADPRRARGRWQEALAVLTQAESRLEEAGDDDLRQRFAQARADLQLATRLEAIRIERAAFVAGDFAANNAVRDYATAFTAAGLELGKNDLTERIRRSAIREQLVAALDDWSLASSNSLVRWRLAFLASAVDPDPRWRNRVPGPLVWDDRAALERLAAEAPLAKLSPQFLTLLGVRLRRAGANPEPFLRSAQWLHPGDFWLNYDLGMALLRNSKPAEAAAFFRAALAARPDCSHVYNKLGVALTRLGKSEEALAAYQRAIELDSQNASAHFNLAEALSDQGQTEQAIAEYHRAIEHDPPAAMATHLKVADVLEAQGQVQEALAEYRRAVASAPRAALPHFQLGTLLDTAGQIGEALVELRRASALDPMASAPHVNIGIIYQKKGQLDEATAEYFRALDLDPNSARAHYQLGYVLKLRGRVDEAIDEFRRAVQLDPKGALGHKALADALLRGGRHAEGRAAAQRGLKTFPESEPLRPAMRRTFDECERMLALDARLRTLLEGHDADQQLRLARECRDYGRPYYAARLYAAAFASRPGLAEDLASRNRYHAACAAARAAAGPGTPEAPLAEPDRAALRGQALRWLQADLALGAKLHRADKSTSAVLSTWQTDAALASLRDRKLLDKLPAGERQQWQRFWADVAAARSDDPLEQGRDQAARRHWSQAAESYARALQLDATDDGHLWFEYAAVLLLCGDRRGYARACAHLVDRCGLAVDLRSYHVARACTLAPDSVPDSATPGRLAHKELMKEAQAFWSLTERAALAYRAGRFREAVPLLEQSLRAENLGGRAVLNWLWLAMSYQRLGNAPEARRWLAKAQAWLDQYADGMPTRAKEELGLDVHNWLEAHILRREAETLLSAAIANSK